MKKIWNGATRDPARPKNACRESKGALACQNSRYKVSIEVGVKKNSWAVSSTQREAAPAQVDGSKEGKEPEALGGKTPERTRRWPLYNAGNSTPREDSHGAAKYRTQVEGMRTVPWPISPELALYPMEKIRRGTINMRHRMVLTVQGR